LQTPKEKNGPEAGQRIFRPETGEETMALGSESNLLVIFMFKKNAPLGVVAIFHKPL